VILFSTSDPHDIDGIFPLLMENEWHPDKRPHETKITSRICDSFVGEYQCSPHSDDPAPRITIRREGDRLFAQTSGQRPLAIRALLPPVEGELIPQSKTCLFGRISGAPITFLRNSEERVVGITVQFGPKTYSYAKVSDQRPNKPEQHR
jgi:hypothetical protein